MTEQKMGRQLISEREDLRVQRAQLEEREKSNSREIDHALKIAAHDAVTKILGEQYKDDIMSGESRLWSINNVFGTARLGVVWKIKPNADTQNNPFMQKLKSIKAKELDGVHVTTKPGIGPNTVTLIVEGEIKRLLELSDELFER